jgi:hypothetical protein
MVSLELFNEAVDVALAEMRKYAGCLSMNQVVNYVAKTYKMSQDEADMLYSDVEFFYGKRK